MDFDEREITFQEADRRYAELRRQYGAGTISDEEFDTQRKRLMVRDEEGRWWAKSRSTGEWHYRAEDGWIKGTPPAYQPPTQRAPTVGTSAQRSEQASPFRVDTLGNGSTQDRSRGRQLRGGTPWTMMAGLIGVVAFAGIGVIIWLLVPYITGENETEPASEEASSPAAEASNPAPGYRLVTDNSGYLTAELPSGWEVITGEESEGESDPGAWSTFADVSVGSSITASSDLDAWYTPGGAASGMYAAASRELAQEYTDNELVVIGPNDGSRYQCTLGDGRMVDRSSYLGSIQGWSCPGNGNAEARTFFTAAVAPEGRECVVALQIWVYSEADLEVARHILDTLEVDCSRI